MQILSNSRQMPKTMEYTANKKYSDVVYAWLQVHSERDDGDEVRWIAKKDVKFVDIAKELSISRQTASNKFKKLLEVDGLIVYNEALKRYELPKFPDNVAWLIQNNTLRVMINALSENCISVYIYLFNRYWAAEQKPFEFTLFQVKRMIGAGLSRSTDSIITDILMVLQKLELIEYELVHKVTETGEYKDIYQIINMRNQIPA